MRTQLRVFGIKVMLAWLSLQAACARWLLSYFGAQFIVEFWRSGIRNEWLFNNKSQGWQKLEMLIGFLPSIMEAQKSFQEVPNCDEYLKRWRPRMQGTAQRSVCLSQGSINLSIDQIQPNLFVFAKNCWLSFQFICSTLVVPSLELKYAFKSIDNAPIIAQVCDTSQSQGYQARGFPVRAHNSSTLQVHYQNIKGSQSDPLGMTSAEIFVPFSASKFLKKTRVVKIFFT